MRLEIVKMQDGVVIWRDDVVKIKNGVVILKNGVALPQDGVVILKNGVGIRPDGVGIWRDGVGIRQDGVGIWRDGVKLSKKNSTPSSSLPTSSGQMSISSGILRAFFAAASTSYGGLRTLSLFLAIFFSF